MNREIKFRGKSKLNGKWVYGDLIHEAFIHTKKAPLAIKEYGMIPTEVDPKTVGQYTGLKDVNGVEIYEGDILSKRWRVTVYCSPKTGTFMIKWGVAPEINKPCTLANYIAKRKRAGTGYRDCETIGNIHQSNPELNA